MNEEHMASRCPEDQAIVGECFEMQKQTYLTNLKTIKKTFKSKQYQTNSKNEIS